MNAALFVPVSPEERLIVQKVNNRWAYVSEESLFTKVFSSLGMFCSFFQTASAIDLACIDITVPKAVQATEDLRKRHAQTWIMLVADDSILPTVYLKPSIMASSLLLRPLNEKQVESVMSELISSYMHAQINDEPGVYHLKTQDGTERIPFDDILYFEARDKKIFLRTLYEEYALYSTIEKLAGELPDYYVRCHRSFLVNRFKIRKIAFPEGMIYLQDGIAVPLARNYRAVARSWNG